MQTVPVLIVIASDDCTPVHPMDVDDDADLMYEQMNRILSRTFLL